MNIDFDSLGFSQEELQERVVNAIADRALHMASAGVDEYGDEFEEVEPTEFGKQLQARVQAKVDESIESIAAKHVLPNVESYVENFCLQRTNEWGDAKEDAMTFTEYLVKRAEQFLTEQVDYEGKTRGEKRGMSFRGEQTRVAHLIDKHLHYSIKTAMTDAMQEANSLIVEGLQETVKIKLAQVLEKLDVKVKTR